MSSSVISDVRLDEHLHAVQRIGNDEAHAPGWYALRGFRSSAPVEVAGPCTSAGEALCAARWAEAQRRPTLQMVWGDGVLPDPATIADDRALQLVAEAAGAHGWEFYDPCVVLHRDRLRLAPRVRVDSFVKLECGGGMAIGDFVHVASFCHLGIGGGLVVLEENTSCGSGTRIISGSNLPGRGHGCSAIEPGAVFSRSYVHVRRNAVLYAGATVLPGVTVGENAVVAAGAVVRCDIPAYEKWAGVPAKKVGEVR